jgi:hypothetical protein
VIPTAAVADDAMRCQVDVRVAGMSLHG